MYDNSVGNAKNNSLINSQNTFQWEDLRLWSSMASREPSNTTTTCTEWFLCRDVLLKLKWWSPIVVGVGIRVRCGSLIIIILFTDFPNRSSGVERRANSIRICHSLGSLRWQETMKRGAQCCINGRGWSLGSTAIIGDVQGIQKCVTTWATQKNGEEMS